MENSVYYKIVNDMIVNKSNHNKIINLVDDIRDKRVENRFCIECGIIPASSLSYRESIKDMQNVRILYQFNKNLENDLSNYKFDNFVGALKN
jgi:hypothetical protein